MRYCSTELYDGGYLAFSVSHLEIPPSDENPSNARNEYIPQL